MAPPAAAPAAPAAPAAAPTAAGASGGKGGDEGPPSLLIGFRGSVASIIFGLVLGLLTVGFLVAIHFSEKTQRYLTILSIVVAIIFAVCIKKLPRGYMFSVLSILMLMAAMWIGFIAALPPLFRILAGLLAVGAGLFKIYFY